MTSLVHVKIKLCDFRSESVSAGESLARYAKNYNINCARFGRCKYTPHFTLEFPHRRVTNSRMIFPLPMRTDISPTGIVSLGTFRGRPLFNVWLNNEKFTAGTSFIIDNFEHFIEGYKMKFNLIENVGFELEYIFNLKCALRVCDINVAIAKMFFVKRDHVFVSPAVSTMLSGRKSVMDLIEFEAYECLHDSYYERDSTFFDENKGGKYNFHSFHQGTYQLCEPISVGTFNNFDVCADDFHENPETFIFENLYFNTLLSFKTLNL